MHKENDWSGLNAQQVSQAVAQRRFTAERFIEEMLGRHERLRTLGHASWLLKEQALQSARDRDAALSRGANIGLLGGVPMFVKDNINTAGCATSTGTPSLKRYLPKQDAEVVQRLKRAGAVVLGKANMHEMAVGGTCANLEFGFVRNPHNPAFVAGGSSGGSAVAVAAGIVPFSLGTDTMGSVRIPASYCGVAGFRPTSGPQLISYPQSGVFLCARSFDTAGPIARDVNDLRVIHALLSDRPAQPAAIDGSIRVGVPEQFFWEGLARGVEKAGRSALERIEGARVILVPVDIGSIATEASELLMLLLSEEMSRDIPAFLANECPQVNANALLAEMRDPEARQILRACLESKAPEPALDQARSRRLALIRAYREAFERAGIQVIAFPTTAVPPVRLPDAHAVLAGGSGLTETSSWPMVRNTATAAVLGAPSLTVPAGVMEDELPFGLSLDGLPGADDMVLAVGAFLQARLGPAPRPNLAG